MACRGVFFALEPADERRLLRASSDNEVKTVIQEVEERWDQEWLAETDKAWDALHRCLSVDLDEEPILQRCVLGGRQLHKKRDYIINYMTAQEVSEAATALDALDEVDIKDRYYRMNRRGYEIPLSEEDAEYTPGCFSDMKKLFEKAASAGRCVVFTVDQ